MTNNPPSHEVLGLGNPFIDHIIEVDDGFIKKIGGTKGGMVAVDYKTLLHIIKESGKDPLLVLGGSGANTIRGLAHLGHHCGLVGSIGKDAPGIKFLEQLQELGVTSFLIQSETPTAQVVCMVTSDRERTMRSFLGASCEMSFQKIDPNIFQKTKLVHIEGYSIMNGDLTESVMQLAKDAGAKISFDLGSFEVVNAYKDLMIHLISKYVDILFANGEEVYSLTKLDPEQGCKVLKDLCPIAVILLGKEGCLVGTEKKIVQCPALTVEVVDTTGAGDLFASGFLHGYLLEKTIETCARFGTLTASEVVQVRGVNIPLEKWQKLKKQLSNLNS